MHSHGGIRPFFKGIAATGTRDMVFGLVYEVTRTSLRNHFCPEDNECTPRRLFYFNILAGGFATLFSSPFNYARNIQYATHPRKHTRTQHRVLYCSGEWLLTLQIILHLFGNALDMPKLEALNYLQSIDVVFALFNSVAVERLRIGWGSLRVAIGMALGQYIFEATREFIRATE